MNKEIVIRSVRESDYKIIFELCEKRFGKGYLTRKNFDEWLKNPTLCLAAEYEGRFCGFVCYIPEPYEALAKYMKLDARYIKSVSNNKAVIHGKSAVLFEEYEHLGIMQALVEAANNNARELGFGAVFIPAWEYDGFVPVGKMLNRLGFRQTARRENIWYDMENYICVVCGGRCKCSAVIFEKRL